MSIERNVQTVKDCFAAMGRGDRARPAGLQNSFEELPARRAGIPDPDRQSP